MPKPKTKPTLPDLLLSIAEVAEFWNCAKATVDQIIDNGELPAFRPAGHPRMTRVRYSDAVAFFEPVPVATPVPVPVTEPVLAEQVS